MERLDGELLKSVRKTSVLAVIVEVSLFAPTASIEEGFQVSVSAAKTSSGENIGPVFERTVDDKTRENANAVAANESQYSSADVERIRNLIDETGRTVAKFRELVVAQNDVGDSQSGQAQSVLPASASTGDGPVVTVNASRSTRGETSQPMPRSGVLWAALKTKDSNDASVDQLPVPGRAELVARRQDEKLGRPKAAPLVNGRPTHHEDDDTLPDFFTLRLSLRYLQFRHQSGAAYGDEIKNEYTLLLEGLSEAAVKYKAMHRSTHHHREATERLEKARRELRAEMVNAQKQTEEMDGLRRKLLEQKQTTDKVAAEFEAFRKEQTDLTATVEKEREAFEKDKKQRVETMSLLVAETSVLRQALSDACDTIADDMSQRMITETLIQDLEDKLAAQSAGARKLERYAD